MVEESLQIAFGTSQTAVVLQQLVTLVHTFHVAVVLCCHDRDWDLLDLKRTNRMVLALAPNNATGVSWMGGGHEADCLVVIPAGVHKRRTPLPNVISLAPCVELHCRIVFTCATACGTVIHPHSSSGCNPKHEEMLKEI